MDAQSTSAALGHIRDLAAEDSMRVPSRVEAHHGSDALPVMQSAMAGGSTKRLQARAPSRTRPELTSPCRRKQHQLQGQRQEPRSKAALLPQQDSRHRVSSTMVLGYCAAQGLTRAGTRRQEGVKHLSCLICQL